VVIILAVVCVILAAGAGFFLVQNNDLNAQLTESREGLVNIANAAGSGALSAEDSINPAVISEAIDNLTGEIETMASDLVNARSEITRQRGELNEANTALEAASVQTTSLRGQLENARRDLQESRSEAEAAAQQHSEESARLNEQINSLSAQVATLEASVGELNGQVAGLEKANTEANQEIERLRKQLVSRPAAPATPEAASAASPDSEAVQSEATEEDFGTETQENVEAAIPNPDELSMTVPDGASRYFSKLYYNKANSTLSLTSLNGRTLTYFDVPVALYDGLAAAPVLDVYFRFRLMDQYASDPVDIVFMRSLD